MLLWVTGGDGEVREGDECDVMGENIDKGYDEYLPYFSGTWGWVHNVVSLSVLD